MKSKINTIDIGVKDQVRSFISAPEPKAQVHYFDHALSVRLSVCLSIVNFSHFRLLL